MSRTTLVVDLGGTPVRVVVNGDSGYPGIDVYVGLFNPELVVRVEKKVATNGKLVAYLWDGENDDPISRVVDEGRL